LGNSSVGKSSICNRFTRNNFNNQTENTIGAMFISKNLDINNKTYRLDIWDTAGQERYRSMTHMYYRNADGAIVTFDLCVLDSLIGATSWINELKNHNVNIVIILVGNKCDMINTRKIPYETAKKYANDNNIIYIETSAKNNINITECFIRLTEKMLEYRNSIDYSNNSEKIDINNKKGDTGCFCNIL
jgi:small GTP-binding protein